MLKKGKGKIVKRFIIVLTSFISCLVLSQSLGETASAKVHNQRYSALISHPSKMRTVNDSRVHFVSRPGRYTHMRFRSKSNRVRSVAGKKVTFNTRLLLPDPGKDNEKWENPQSIAFTKNNMMYIVYCPKAYHNQGRIVRYDLTRLQKLGVYKHPRDLRDIYVKHHGKFSKRQQEIQKAVKVGGIINTGHGQTLAYNPKDNGLYMWRDNRNNSGSQTSTHPEIQQINPNSLKPEQAIRFYLRAHGTSTIGGGTLTFDQYGNAYYWAKSGFGAYVYKGHVSMKDVKFRRTDQFLKRSPGTYEQSMGYNAKRGRLYLISDDSIASFPSKQLNGHGSLNSKSFEWSRLSPRRETEGLTFDESGYGYLLMNHNPSTRSDSVY